jgi:integrase/recombinase XerD
MQGFQQFIRERQYLHNVSPRTLEWYENSFRWLPCEDPTQAQLNEVVIQMRERGRKATGCNCVSRAINSYLHWRNAGDAKCSPACKHPKILHLKEPHLVLPTFTAVQVTRLVTWKPQKKHERRLHLLVLFLLDTGCRISEALTLRVRDIDFDNLLVTLNGKGDKQRVVPFSFELRKVMFRYCQQFARTPERLLFANNTETELARYNVLRNVKALCLKLGFEAPRRTLHSFRHTFSINYLRRGGSVFHLQKCLGHSTLEMTKRYANLSTADIQAVHQRISLLSK